LEVFFSILLLGEVFRQRHLDLIPFNPDYTTGDGDVRIFGSLAGLHIESPSVPGALDDATIQLAFSERSSCVRAGVVHGVEGSVDIEQRNPDSLDFDGTPGSQRDFFYCRDGEKFGQGADPSCKLNSRGNRYIPKTGLWLDFNPGLWHREAT
jgi:hypothetical protein